MKTTQAEIFTNLNNQEWLRAFAADHLADKFQTIEATEKHWRQDQPEPPSSGGAKFVHERGIILLKFGQERHYYTDCDSGTGYGENWWEMVLLESGRIVALKCSDIREGVFSGFKDPYVGIRHLSRFDMPFGLSPQDYARHADTMAGILYWLAQGVPNSAADSPRP